MSDKFDLVRKIANGEIFTALGAAERRPIKELIDDYDRLKDNAETEELMRNSFFSERGRLLAKEKLLSDALNKIIAMSHSWYITQETGALLAPVHNQYRNLAKDTLAACERIERGEEQ